MNPSLSAEAASWEEAYMPDDGRTPLQNLLADAVARSEHTRDYFDSMLRAALSTTGKPLWDIERGKVRRPSPKVLRAIEEAMDLEPESLVDLVHPRDAARGGAPKATLAGPRGDRPEQPKAKTADSGETAPVTRLDMSYSMGPGTEIDDSYIDGEAFQFDLGFLRSMTVTPPDRIRIVDGIGDSMQPTLHDRDMLFIDINQRDLNAQDRIWACWIFGMGAVKRLRALSADTVLVMSDNPDVPDQEVSRKDILIHGRVVGSIKRH